MACVHIYVYICSVYCVFRIHRQAELWSCGSLVVPTHLIWLDEGNLPAVYQHLNQRLSEEDSLKCWSYSNCCCCCSEGRVSQSLDFIWNVRDVLIVVLASIQNSTFISLSSSLIVALFNLIFRKHIRSDLWDTDCWWGRWSEVDLQPPGDEYRSQVILDQACFWKLAWILGRNI